MTTMTYISYKNSTIEKYDIEIENEIDKSKIHYVYRITDIKLKKHYIGSKSECGKPTIGINYFSSSYDKQFIESQKNRPKDFKYKIIKFFNSKQEKILFESFYHEKFNVNKNPSFFNKSKQRPNGFDTTGLKFNHGKGLVQAKNIKNGKIVRIHKDEFDKRKDLVGATKGFVSCIEKKTGKKLSIKTEEFRRNRDLYTHHSEGTRASENTKIMMSKSRKGLKHTDETKDKISKGNLGKKVSEESKNKMKNSKRKRFKIYDSEGSLRFDFKKPFLKFCNENNLPSNALLESYRNNGSKIYQTDKSIKLSRFQKANEFVGWYCIKID